MMNEREYLLTKLTEECAEVSQRACKALTFGVDEVQSGQTMTNAERIWQEWNDLRAIVEMLQTRGVLPKNSHADFEAITEKKLKVFKFMEYSRECGALEPRRPLGTPLDADYPDEE